MNGFVNFGRVSLFVMLLATFAGRLVLDLIAGEYGKALKNAFAYSTFITLVYGLLLTCLWIVLNVFLSISKARRPPR